MKIKMRSLLAASVFVVAGMAFAGSTPDEVPCAMMLKFGRGTQVIPPEGKVQTRFEADQPIVCGSMVITHADSVWIRHSNQTVFKIGPNSFFELGKAKAEPHRLYRGQLLMTAPPSIPELTLSTPNGEVSFKGGVAWIQYAPEQKETSVASFNRNFEFKNKFNEEALQNVRVGEISRLILNQDRLVPSQPVVMSPSSVKEALNGFELAAAEQTELTKVVERVFEARAKSLTSDIDDWAEIERTEQASRSIASVPEKASKNTRSAIDPKEAKFSMDLLKKHLYGDEEDMKMLNDDSGAESVRAPASAKKLQDPEYDRMKAKKKQETQRLMKEVSELQ
jgi:hypothetical protein